MRLLRIPRLYKMIRIFRILKMIKISKNFKILQDLKAGAVKGHEACRESFSVVMRSVVATC